MRTAPSNKVPTGCFSSAVHGVGSEWVTLHQLVAIYFREKAKMMHPHGDRH
jgi:hypothetical protein